MSLAKLGKGMLFLVEQAFVGRDEKRAPLKTPAWEAIKLLVQLNPLTKSGLLDLTNLPIANYRQMSQFSIICFSQGL